ncbi:response regulator [Sphingomonas sp. H39-1-10]|uniref:response regulator n=1 Tax=Sphingomonas TaxID=13687 RepID=UPI0008896E51|nr:MULTISPECIES: response regulator [Sphingomonas]MDF0486796.1 response regulator [Sphingomonas pollutisoli]SDA35162.1 Response regulator receiver domain-containing protein [Sphingomonas sp. NFR15]
MKILYVDDEPDIRTIVGMALRLDAGLDVRMAESGPDALRLLDAGGWTPDFALIDMMMPGMSGGGLLAALRRRAGLAALPALFVTASARRDDIRAWLDLGADGVLTKPFDPMTLATVVRGRYAEIISKRTKTVKNLCPTA